RYAIRSLRRSPAFAVTAVVTLVIGVGAAVAIFAVVNGVLLRPLPYRDPERLVGAWHDFTAMGLDHGEQSATTYWTYQSQARSIDGIGIYTENAVNVAELGSPIPPARVASTAATASLFRVLGVPPEVGRTFTEADDRPNASPVILISDAMWRVRFGGDAGVIGRNLDINGVTREIVGVMPRSFRFPSAE